MTNSHLISHKEHYWEAVTKDLYRIKTNFPFICRRWIIESTFLSLLDYRDVIYRLATTALRPSDSVYRSALRFITGRS